MSSAEALLSRQSRIVVVSAAIVGATAIVAATTIARSSLAPSTTPPPGTLVALHASRIECKLAHRPAVTRELRTGPVIRLSNRRHIARVHVAAFTFLAKLFAEPASAEPASLSIRVSQRTTGKVIAAALYQRVTNNHYATHGFTGLLYSYTPRGAELQYFCRSRP
jgi:hypothetical protein